MWLQHIVVFIIFAYVNGNNTKGSLTFVIDDSRSMYDVIEQVKEQTNKVFDAVLNSNASKIDDFIIVTFNDPGTKLNTVTRDPEVFKKALSEITVHGNLDCPEYAMKGIELALENSKPNSFFYVFTDAAAKDYKEYDRIKSLGLKKSIQVTFLLTGECPDSPLEANAVYDKLAAATNGQVFHLEKQDIKKIMGYITTSVNHIKTTLAHKYFDTALNKKFQFSIDSKVWDVIISVSGVCPKYHITGPDGNKVEMKTFIDTEKSHISKLEAKPGVYTVHLDSEGAISTVITGSTSVSFQHGFATVQPNTLNETSTKPISGLPSYLSIALDNIDRDLSLDTIEIRDINDNFISEFPLTLIDKNQQFYITKPLLTPNSTFKLAINGHTKTKEKITRVLSTTIEPQKPELDKPKPKAPTVTILEGTKIIGDYGRDLTLKCKVNAFPKPDVIWQDNLNTLYSSEIVPLDLPYEYMSILKIDKVNKNVTIQCKAYNVMGEKSEHITVETKLYNHFIKVPAVQKDTTLEYGTPKPKAPTVTILEGTKIIGDYDKDLTLKCKVNAFPKPDVIWQDNLKNLYSSEIVPLDLPYEYMSILKIDKVNKNFTMQCRAGNAMGETSEHITVETKLYNHFIKVPALPKDLTHEYGKPKPKAPTVTILEGTKIIGDYDKDLTLKCKVNAFPKPDVIWQDNLKNLYSSEIVPLDLPYEYMSILKIDKVNKNFTMQCRAGNAMGETSEHITVETKLYNHFIKVPALPKDTTHEYGEPKPKAPTITILEGTKIIGDYDKDLTLKCKVNAFPKPDVIWQDNLKNLYSSEIVPLDLPYEYMSILKIDKVNKNFTMQCRAGNVMGETTEHITVETKLYNHFIKVPALPKDTTHEYGEPKPKAPTVTILEGTKIIGDYDKDLTLKCKVNAFPKPDVIWQDNLKNLYSSEIVPLDLPYEYMSILKIDKVNKNFTIQCRAGNVMGETSEHITVETKLYNHFIKVLAFPKDTTLEYGAPAELNFRVKSFPQVKITWYINGKQIQNNTDYEVSSDGLRIRQMRQELKGDYTVEAFNDEERKTHHFKIDISGVIPVIDKNTSNYKAKKGSNVNISCRILKSKPSPVISWTFKPEGLETSIPFKEVTETLHLNNVGLKQIGTYTCLVQNEFGTDSHGVDLFVEYPPIIEKVETEVKIPEGDLVNLNCLVDGSPLPLVRWLFNEVEINNKAKYKYNNNSLSFTGSIEDNGIYTCEAINSLGKAEKAFYVTIFSNPVIDKSISDYKVERGSNMNISCRILKSKLSPVIFWTFKQKGSETSIPLKEVTETLHLNNVGPKQSGTYTCLVQNEFGTDSHGVELFVEYPPIIEKVETQVKIPEGDLVNLHCLVDGSPLPLVRWLFNEVEINNTSKYKYNNNSLSFTGSIEDNGIYTCEAINSLGKAEKAFYVTIFSIPVIDKSISDYKVERGSNMNISCRILKSKLSPVISWTFKPEGSDTSIRLKEMTETLHLNNVGPKQSGTYTCFVQNEFGTDSHGVDLFVEYPPIIEKVETQVKIPVGDLVNLHCLVDGSPLPLVRWLLNEVEINNTEKYKYYNNSLSFTGSIEDNGIYTCEATNSLGKAENHFYVTFNPVKAAVPKNSKLEVNLGDSVNLACLAVGYPKPIVQWSFRSKNPSILPKLLRADSTGSIFVKHIQIEDEGFYTCSASNFEGLQSTTYEIHVKAIPAAVSILANPLGSTTYDAVKGDLALRIPCNAIGSPKPVVTWEADGYYITSGTHFFDIEEDGTLIIKYPTLNSAGSYTCRANNDFSSDLKEFTVNVTPYPQLDNVTETLNLEIGTSQHVECDLPHRDGDVVTWFKNGRHIATDELYLKNLTIQDSGVYSCRVSTFMSAHTLHKEVIVGCKPIFTNEKDINIDFIEGTFAYLDCSAYGEPKPQIIWKKNGNFMKPSNMDMTYIFEMKPDVVGSYECVVSNKFGNINRTFNIQDNKDCLLDIEKDFNKNQPLLLSQSRQWPDFKKLNNFIRIPKSTHFLLSCPGNTVTYKEEEFEENVKALCINNSTFKIRDRNVDFSKITCKKQIKPLVKSTNQSCFSGNTELLKVGFMLKRNILEVYDICIDKDNKIPVFTRHNLHQGISGTLPKEHFQFTGSKYLRFSFDDMYQYKFQLQFIHFMTGKNLNNPNKCCFKKRQLVNPIDVIPGLSQVATFSYLNVIPQWSTCGTENWDEIERRIRSLAMFSNINLSIFTGSSYPLTLPGQGAAVFLSDTLKRRQPVPMFIWKVVQNNHDKSSLAIIQLNIPNITLSEALSYVPCEDICDEVEWMKNDHWHDVDKGFTFCCNITEFSSYYGTLIKGHDKVFKTILPW